MYRFLLVVFLGLNAVDLGLYLWFIEGTGQATELNPIMNWVRQEMGLSGVVLFKLLLLLFIIQVWKIGWKSCPKRVLGCMIFGCVVAGFVVSYSLILLSGVWHG